VSELGAELLDAVIARIEDINIPCLIHSEVFWKVESEILILRVNIADLPHEFQSEGELSPELAALFVLDDLDSINDLDLLSRIGTLQEGGHNGKKKRGPAPFHLHCRTSPSPWSES
jgi:hypothetical protein